MQPSGILDKVPVPIKHLQEYRVLAPLDTERIYETARRLKDLKVTHINTVSLGGGVAEMLRSLVPLERDAGLDANWFTIPPNLEFFEITKKIHNLLQGKNGGLTEEEKLEYLEYNKFIAKLLDKLNTDILVIHDPQPLAALSFMKKRPKIAIWRCHIHTTNPNNDTKNFLSPFIQAYDQVIFSLPEYADGFELKNLSFITPVIDPLSEKNIPMQKSAAKKYIEQFGINGNAPLVTQISRFDPWKDPLGVIQAYSLAKKDVPNLQLALVAQMANDDPESLIIYESLKKIARKDKNIFLLANLPENDLAVKAFQTASDIILQKSIKEGFGLTVTEAMFKGAVVIGGNTGGIRAQIKDGINGILVNSPKEAADKIIYLLKNPGICKKISLEAQKSVKENFLVTTHLVKELELYKNLLKVKPRFKPLRTYLTQLLHLHKETDS